MINYVWPVQRVRGWLIVTCLKLCKAGLTGFLGLYDSSSSNQITTGGTTNSRIPNGHNKSMSIQCQYHLVRRTKKWANFHVVSTIFFEIILKSENAMLLRHTFFDVILMGEKSISFRCKLFVISMYFFDAVSIEGKSECLTSECLFWCVFER